MTSKVKGVRGWLVHRLVANFWVLAVLAVTAAPIIAVTVLILDRAFLTDWLVDRGLSPVATPDALKSFAEIATGADAAFIALYFSASLFVLSLAAGNLGVRLIDRWLDRPLARVSIAGLSFVFVFTLTMLLAIDADAPLRRNPLGLLMVDIVLQLVNTAMLAVALHDLGRTMFVDASIHRLGRDAREIAAPVTGFQRGEVNATTRVAARKSGYIESVDLPHLSRLLGDAEGRARVLAPPGSHILVGEPLIELEGLACDRDRVCDAIAIGDYRSHSQGTVFHIRLLVEIAARALSPAVNDFYTAMVCADHLADAMLHQSGCWVDEGAVPVWSYDDRIELPGQDFRGLFEDPLHAFRQSAAHYPPVAIRMIDNYARLLNDGSTPAGLRQFLLDKARCLAQQAERETGSPVDAAAIRQAIARLPR